MARQDHLRALTPHVIRLCVTTRYQNIMKFHDEDGSCRVDIVELSNVCSGAYYAQCISFLDEREENTEGLENIDPTVCRRGAHPPRTPRSPQLRIRGTRIRFMCYRGYALCGTAVLHKAYPSSVDTQLR